MSPLQIQRHIIVWNALVHKELPGFGFRPDGVSDDDGQIGPRTMKAMQAFLEHYGALTVEEAVNALEKDIASYLSPDRSLGERALAFAFQEWLDGVQEEPLGSNTGPRIKEYFAVCERDGKPIQLRVGEWCAAAASWCTMQALQPGEISPHGFRIGGMEIQGDLTRSGHWRSLSDVQKSRYLPKAGDIVVLTRPTAASWTRHICRLVHWDPKGFWTLGGNENNRWRLTFRRIEDGQLLGFGSYPQPEAWTEADEKTVEELCPGLGVDKVSEPVCR